MRLIPAAEIGVWILFTSITSLLETIRNGFIRNPFITYFVSAEPGDRDRFIASSFWLHGIVALAMSVFLVAFGGLLTDFWDAQPLDQLCLIYAVTSILLVPYLQFEYLMQSAIRFDGIFITNAIKLSLLSIYIIVLFVLKRPPSLVELAAVQLASVLVTLAISYSYVKSMLHVSFRPDRKLMNTLFHFGKYTFGTTISSMAIKSTDSWMIGRMMSTTAVAMYNPALRISNLVEVPTLAISNLVFPQVHKRMQQEGDKGIQDIYYKSVGLILAVMLPMVIPMYAFAEFIIVTIFGDPYRAAIPVLQVTVFYTLIIPFNRQFGTIMDALKMPKLNFYLLLAVGVLNIVFNYFFITAWGIVGAAYGTVSAYCLVFVLNQVILYYKFKISLLKIPGAVGEWYVAGWKMFISKVMKRN